MSTQQEEVIINRSLDYSIRKRRVDANTAAIAEWLMRANMPVNIETIPQAYKELLRNNQLVDSAAWQDACAELRQARDTYQFNEGVFGMVAEHIDGDTELSSMSVTGDTLVMAFDEVNAKWPFARNQRYLAEQAAIAERARLIAEIANGRTDYYEARSGNNYYVQKFSVSDLYTDTTERLREIHGIVISQRELQNMDSKQWLEEKRKESIRRDQERAGMIPTDKKLPSHWTPSEDGTFSNTGTVIRAGVPVALTREVFCRLSKTDMRLILSKFGSKLVDELLQIRR
jgi:hypothetical protein